MICSKCGMQNTDDAAFCRNCGETLAEQSAQNQQSQQNQQNQQNQQWQQNAYGQQFKQQMPYYADPYNHTSKFDQSDISNNKIYAMLPYLLGWLGVIVALLASKNSNGTSNYAEFHVRQALKITVVNTLLGILALVLCWTFIVPVLCVLCMVVLFVVKIIGFFSVCSGNAKELPIIRSLGFLK